MRCSGRRVLARRRCSTSSRGCCARAPAVCGSTAATSLNSSTVQRNIAQVFQFPVIYDTMTVFDNLAFPLRNRGVAAADVRSRVSEVAEMLDLTNHLQRRASGLAADEKQKVSLGRGLVRSDVSAILFDEPLTVVDPNLKWRLRRKTQGDSQTLQHDSYLRDSRPGRGADLRRPRRSDT